MRYSSILAGAVSAGAMLLTACSGVGDGNGLKSLRIVPNTGQDGDTVVEAWTCVSSGLTLVATFDDGGEGNFTARANWISSDPDIVEVSNSDIEVFPDDEDSTALYGYGTLVPRGAGTATVTATYLDLSVSIDVTVNSSGAFVLDPAAPRVATTTYQQIRLTTLRNGEEVDLTSLARFSIVGQDPEDQDLTDNVAVLSGSAPGRLVSYNIGAVEVQAYLPLCAEQVLVAPVTVMDPVALTLQREDGFDGRLVAGTTEALTAYADFGEGPEQDLSGQLDMESSNADVASISSASGLPIVVTAREAADEPVSITGTLNYGDDENTDEVDYSFTLTSNALEIEVLDVELESVELTPEEAVIQGFGSTFDFAATGHFAGDYSQDVTRHVQWTSSDTEVATVVTGVGEAAGRATSRTSEGGAVTITATDDDATVTSTDTATLTIDPES